jgi:hypothetical protein
VDLQQGAHRHLFEVEVHGFLHELDRLVQRNCPNADIYGQSVF